MKKSILLLNLTIVIIVNAYSQNTTSYGQYASTKGESNSFFGSHAGYFNSDYTSDNTAIGAGALTFGGLGCTAVGVGAAYNNHYAYMMPPPYTGAVYNTAIGYHSLKENPYGDYNTAVGAESLYKNKDNNNSAVGYHALHENDDGNNNSAMGVYSLYANTSGYHNTAIGVRSLYSNTTGYRNTAVGMYALNFNLLGNFNTATGNYALYTNNMGTHNAGHGYRAAYNNTTGSYNTAHGSFSLDDNLGGSYNTAVGYNAGPSVDLLNNTTAIGYLATPTASNQVRIGNTTVTSIGGYSGWTDLSDGRFKKDIKEDVSGLEFIAQLRPVSYTVDNEGLNRFLHVHDSSSNQPEAKSVPLRKTGFIAQEVEALIKKTGYVFSGVDAPENENDPYGIRYSEFVVPLVKGMQELAAKVESQQQQIALLLAQLEQKNEKAVTGNSSALLLQNSPNPFDAETIIQMTLPDNVGMVSVMIYNLEGKQMKNVQVSERSDVKVKISANELSAGMYLYSLIADGKVVDTKRMVLTK